MIDPSISSNGQSDRFIVPITFQSPLQLKKAVYDTPANTHLRKENTNM